MLQNVVLRLANLAQWGNHMQPPIEELVKRAVEEQMKAVERSAFRGAFRATAYAICIIETMKTIGKVLAYVI